MKKTFRLMIVCAIVVSFAACSKGLQEAQFAEGEQNAEIKMVTEKVAASAKEGDTKATLDNGGIFAWTEGDLLAVHTTAGYYKTSTGADAAAASASFAVTYPEGENRNAFAVYPANLIFDGESVIPNCATSYGQESTALVVKLPATYPLTEVSGTTSPIPMIATNTTGYGWTFKQLCGVLRLTVNSIPADATGLLLDFHGHKVHGEFSVASPVTPGTSTIETAVDNDNDQITVTFDADVTSATLNIPLPVGSYNDISITPIGSETKVSTSRHIKAGGYTAARAHGKKLTATLVSFTINSSGDKVVFAPGNLQAIIASYDDETKIATASSWRFAPNQYDVLRSISAPFPFTVGEPYDMFEWVGESADYNSYGLISAGSRTDELHGNVAGETLKSDWGKNIIASYQANEWYTLADYGYLLRFRSASTVNGVENARFAVISINNTVYGKGLLIFPDNYTHPASLSAKQPDNINVAITNGLTLTNYSYDEWKLMEDAGAIFLPYSGYRGSYGSTCVAVAGQCFTWTSRSSTSNVDEAMTLFNYANATNVDPRPRSFAVPVRLARSLD